MLTSLVICLFARNVYTQDVVLQALAPIGFAWSPSDLARLGEETLRLKNDFKTREGFDMATLRIPQRILETPSPLGRVDEAFIRATMRRFAESI